MMNPLFPKLFSSQKDIGVGLIQEGVDEVVIIRSWTKFLLSERLSNVLALLMMPDGLLTSVLACGEPVVSQPPWTSLGKSMTSFRTPGAPCEPRKRIFHLHQIILCPQQEKRNRKYQCPAQSHIVSVASHSGSSVSFGPWKMSFSSKFLRLRLCLPNFL